MDQAQRLLARHATSLEHTLATSYLATRLLYLRDRLAPELVVERLTDLLREVPDFPEAQDLLELATRGVRGPHSIAPPPPALGSAPLSTRPTVKPDVWPPRDLVEAIEQPPESERPTAVPELVFTGLADPEPVRIVVDTRADLGFPSSGWADRDSVPPPNHSVAPPGPSSLPPAPQRSWSSPPQTSQHPSEPPVRSLNPSRASQPPSLRAIPELARAGLLWPSVERNLVHGDRRDALEQFTQNAVQQLSHLPSADARREFEVFGLNAAELLNKSWVTHHFGPFDLSLRSLARLEAAIGTLCLLEPWPEPHPAVLLALGSYVGEVLRLSHRGEWLGSSTQPRLARVRAGALGWQPFQSVRHWLLSGGRVSLFADLSPGMARPGTLAWQVTGKIKIKPCVLWHGDVTAAQLPSLGRAVSESVLSVACRLLYGHALDGSSASLESLEKLWNALSSSAQPLSGQEPWLLRLAVLLGAYVGEILSHEGNAEWLETSPQLGPTGLSLRLPNGRDAAPMAYFVTRAVTQRPLDLELYANVALGQAE